MNYSYPMYRLMHLNCTSELKL